ncbi:MAG: TolC family protein [Candidatus Kapaibacteriota bacterium]|jgi:outer membrane protein
MKFTLDNTFLLLLILIFGSSISFSQNKINQTGNFAQKINLEDCYKLAIENNVELKTNNYRIKSAEANIKSENGNYLPSVNFNMGYNRQISNVQAFVIGGRLITQPNTFSMNANASLNLFDGLARENSVDRAYNELDITKLNIERTAERVKYDIYKAFLNLLQTQQIVKIREQNLEMGKSELERIKGLFDYGVLTIDNVYSQEAEVGTRELDFIRAENDFNIAKTNLLRVIGINPIENIEIDYQSIKSEINDNDINSFKLQYSSLENNVNLALGNRKDYIASQSSINSAEYAIDIAYSGYLPSLNANTGWSWLNSEFTNFGERGQATASLNLNIPIFDKFQNNANIEQQKLQLEMRQMELFQMEQNIKSTIYSNLQNLNAAVKQIKITEKSLKSAELNYKSALERYNSGVLNINDLTIANLQFTNAKINQINATYNYLAAEKDILFALGKFE